MLFRSWLGLDLDQSNRGGHRDAARVKIPGTDGVSKGRYTFELRIAVMLNSSESELHVKLQL